MAIKSQLFSQFPWIGGLNTSVDPGQVAPNQLVQADNVVFSTSGSRKKRPPVDFSFDNVNTELDEPWTPALLTDSLALWLDADDSDTITLNGSNISQWNDKSGNERHASQATAASQPEYVSNAYNGKFAVRGDGVDDFLTITPFSVSAGIRAYAVINPTTPPTIRRNGDWVWMTDFISANPAFSGHPDFPIRIWYSSFFSQNRPLISGTSIPPDTLYLSYIEQTGTELKGRVFGLIPESSAAATLNGSPTTKFQLFSGPPSFGSFDICEVVFAQSPTLNEQQKLEGYLAHKWGLTASLPSDHPYKNSAPLVPANDQPENLEIVGGHDFWYDTEGAKNQIHVVVREDGVIESCSTSGTRAVISEAAEVQEITVQSKSNFSDADYFTLDAASGANYYVWYDTTGSAVDPNISGRTGIEVSASDVTAASDIAAATATAIGASSDFTATSAGVVVTITDATTGPVSHAADGSGLDGFTYEVTTVGASNWDSPNKVSFQTFNNRLFMAADGTSNKIKVWDGSGTAYDLEDDPNMGSGTPPNGSILGTHLGRLWTNEKTRPDRLHYCETFNHLQWQGWGDSGAIDIGLGDGDPEGISAIFPSFRGALHVAKKTKLYRVVNQFPETFQVVTVSKGLGCVSHNSVATIDQTDIVFVSLRGVHSLAATNEFGDFNSKYLSADIQRTFTDDFDQAELNKCQGIYLSQLNSYLLAVTDDSVGTNTNSALYLYNIPLNSWYRWRFNGELESRTFRSIWKANDADKERFYVGSNNTKIGKAIVDGNSDKDEEANNVAIELRIKTGLIALDGNVYSRKAFKRFSLIYKPEGTHSVTVEYKLDDYAQQSLSYSSSSSQDVLGSTFVLGTSVLGATFVMGPQTVTIEGYGRLAQFTFEQTGIEDSLDIQGFQVEYVPAGRLQQTALTTAGGDT